jgi:hypothetical protein
MRCDKAVHDQQEDCFMGVEVPGNGTEPHKFSPDCMYEPASSRVCEMGTRCCNVKHEGVFVRELMTELSYMLAKFETRCNVKIIFGCDVSVGVPGESAGVREGRYYWDGMQMQGETSVRVMTNDELLLQAEKLARKHLNCSMEEAYRKLDAGELNGTILEVELKCNRWMREGHPEAPDMRPFTQEEKDELD